MITLILLAIAGVFNAIYEILFTSYKYSVFSNLDPQYWDPKTSWKYKWKYPLRPAPVKWYYFVFQPRYKERFPYSSTILVWLTDAWHLFKALMLGCLMGAIVFYTPIIHPLLDFVIFYITFTFTFTIFYEYILRK
jgi:hypothetical protein